MTDAPITFAAVAQPLAERGWRPFPGQQATKIPAMAGWSGLNGADWDAADLAATVAGYHPADDYCCCLAVQREITAIDLDILDAGHAASADRLANDILGRTPLVRIGFAPKQVRLYRSGDAARSRKLHPLEIFSGSGQIVAYGWHQKAGRPYTWLERSPLDTDADSGAIPQVTRAQLDHFATELFKIVPRRLLPNRQGRSSGTTSTIGERLSMLSTLYGSWKRAAAIVLSEAGEGSRNETAWAVVSSAAGRGIPDAVVWGLFERHFHGWAGASEAQVAAMIERACAARRQSSMPFTTSAGGGDAAHR